MANDDVGAAIERLFQTFIAPLVLGGALAPGRPFGGQLALRFDSDRPPVDPERFSIVQLARCRAGRALVPVDRFENFSREELILSAVLHDLVQATHPELVGVFRKNAPRRLTEIAHKTLEHVAQPESAKEALARHTLFARMFEITRTETALTWWTGSATFIGTEPPARLTAWPEFRRVNVTKTPHPLMTLPVLGAEDLYSEAFSAFLARTPLTDLATCKRTAPAFAWSPAVIALLRTRAGRTLAFRALAQQEPSDSVDHALGRATLTLFETRAFTQLGVVMDLLGERALSQVQTELLRTANPAPLAQGGTSDTAFARAAGALAAGAQLKASGRTYSEREHAAMRSLLSLRATSEEAKRIEAFFAPAKPVRQATPPPPQMPG
jgi:hypothetical protein